MIPNATGKYPQLGSNVWSEMGEKKPMMPTEQPANGFASLWAKPQEEKKPSLAANFLGSFAQSAYPDIYEKGQQRKALKAQQQEAQDQEQKIGLAKAAFVLKSLPPEERMKLAQQISGGKPVNPMELQDDALDGKINAGRIAGFQPPESKRATTTVNDRLIDTQTGEVIGDYSDAPEQYRTLTADEAAQMGLPGGQSYQVGPDGKIDVVRAPSSEGRYSNVPRVLSPGSVLVGPDGQEIYANPANPNVKLFNDGGVPSALDARTGQSFALSTPERVGSNKATSETIQGEEAARLEAQQGLPQYVADTEIAISAVDALLEDGLYRERFGSIADNIPALGNRANLAESYLKKIKGDLFLQAYQKLKGGGQITEIEGTKAENAMARLSTPGISENDAKAALEELRSILQNGIERAKAQASGQLDGFRRPEIQEEAGGLTPEEDQELRRLEQKYGLTGQ